MSPKPIYKNLSFIDRFKNKLTLSRRYSLLVSFMSILFITPMAIPAFKRGALWTEKKRLIREVALDPKNVDSFLDREDPPVVLQKLEPIDIFKREWSQLIKSPSDQIP